jgi:PAS domain S-box-containing protein
LKSDKEIQKMIREALRPLVFNNGRGYFFIYDMQGNNVLLPFSPHLEGKNLWNFQDSKGEYNLRKTVKMIREQGEGFQRWHWWKPGETELMSEKIGYHKHFEPYDWWIGTGEYLEDFERDIQQETLEWINKIRFGQDGYIFAYNFNGTILAHFLQERIGHNILQDTTDPYGIKIVGELIRISQQEGGGFLDYEGKIRPSTGLRAQKIGHSQSVKDWQWTVGAGVYVDAINDVMAVERKNLIKKIVRDILEIFVVFVFALVIIGVVLRNISRRTTDHLTVFTRFFKQAATKSKKIDDDAVRFSEFKLLAHSANQMVDDRKKAENALRISEERLDLALSATNQGVWDWNMETDEFHFDERYYTMSGYEPHEFPEAFEAWEKRVHPQDVEVAKSAVEQYLSGESPHFDAEFRFLRKGGDYMWIRGKGKIVARDDQGNPARFIGTHADITERKQIEESLRITKFCFDKADVGIYRIGTDGKILEVNEKAARILGYSREELAALSIFDVDPLLTRDLWSARWQTLREIKTDTFEVVHRGKEGSEIPVEINSNLLEYNDQQFSLAFAQDITERKQAEEALRKNEQLLSNVLESINDGVVVLDKEFKHIIFNRGMEMMLNTPKHKVLGKRPWEAFPMLKNSPVEEHHRKAMKGEVTGSIDIQMSLPHNPDHWARDSFSPLKDTDGRIIGIVGVVSDITRQKQDEEELRRLRNSLSNIIDSMPSVLVAVDGDGKVTQWNSQTEKTTGLSFEEARDRPLTEVFPSLVDAMGRIGASIRERRVISTPKVSRVMEQETRFEDITIFPLVANGVEGAVIRVDDVTERVRMEEIMIQSEKMLTVGGLAAGMAHEINNPLAGMLQTAGVMNNRLNKSFDIPANQRAAEAAGTTMDAIESFMKARSIPRMLNTIISSGERVVDVINNMLGFARKGDTEKTSHYAGKILDKTLDLAATDYDLKKQYDFKKIKIVKQYSDNLPAVPCQASEIQQVLLNIFGNGAQAMQLGKTENPQFIVRTYLESNRNMVCVEIEDNGPGMDEVTLKKVFDPFFTTKPKGEGMGLGLSVSYFIITENHKGEMMVESQPGDGTKFIIRLPVDTPIIET